MRRNRLGLLGLVLSCAVVCTAPGCGGCSGKPTETDTGVALPTEHGGNSGKVDAPAKPGTKPTP